MSTDYGNTWTPKDSNRTWYAVSISASGQYQTAVVSSPNGKIYVSTDYGNTWTPKESDRWWWAVSISASGQYQVAVVYVDIIYVSTDFGNTWTPKDTDIAGWQGVSISASGQYITAVAAGGYIYVSNTANLGGMTGGTVTTTSSQLLPVTISGVTYYLQLYTA